MVLENKEKFTSKTLTIEYDEQNKQYHIISCKYNYSDIDTIKNVYSKMMDSFNLYYLKFDINESTNFEKIEIQNFDEITSIYTTNGLEIYKKLNNNLFFEENIAFINYNTWQTLDNPDLLYHVHSTKFSNIEKKENSITCTVSSTLLKNPYEASYPPTENDLENQPFTAKFKILKIDNKWKIDEFNIDFISNQT